ncbi:hypothetical protein FB45DRAFT_859923 [Roridomyces roridus]|uniref:BTB domain-containing protein n=1 Tax=Roridomyces roridus TaxID=1738132 RepID=A0AAD7CL62_9AGAR|nr:hypothetical protein FB45DRAFT_859923 [Roridomyces roridus]
MEFDLDAAGCKLDAFRSGSRFVDVIVEGNPYKIDRFFLERDSHVLKEMFSSETTAHTLSGVTKAELEHLLWIYYNPRLDDYWAPISVWRDALKLADMWEMTQIRYLALSHLKRAKMDIIDRIKLCEREDVVTCEARDAYLAICTREQPLTPTEFQALGMDSVLRIMQIRERIMASRGSQSGNQPAAESIIDDVIGVFPHTTAGVTREDHGGIYFFSATEMKQKLYESGTAIMIAGVKFAESAQPHQYRGTARNRVRMPNAGSHAYSIPFPAYRTLTVVIRIGLDIRATSGGQAIRFHVSYRRGTGLEELQPKSGKESVAVMLFVMRTKRKPPHSLPSTVSIAVSPGPHPVPPHLRIGHVSAVESRPQKTGRCLDSDIQTRPGLFLISSDPIHFAKGRPSLGSFPEVAPGNELILSVHSPDESLYPGPRTHVWRVEVEGRIFAAVMLVVMCTKRKPPHSPPSTVSIAVRRSWAQQSSYARIFSEADLRLEYFTRERLGTPLCLCLYTLQMNHSTPVLVHMFATILDHMHPQGLSSPTFKAGPVDGTLTIPQLIELQLEQSPHHTAFIYDLPGGDIISITFSQYIRTVHAAARRFLRDSAPNGGDGKPTVVALFANTGTAFSLLPDELAHIVVWQTVSPFVRCFPSSHRAHVPMSALVSMCTGAMRAGMHPFNISPRNSPTSLAHLLKETNTAVVYVSSDLRAVLEEALQICGRQLPVFDSLTFENLQTGLEGAAAESLPPVTATMDSTAIVIHSSGSTSTLSRPIYLSHKLLLQYATNPWYSNEDHCGQLQYDLTSEQPRNRRAYANVPIYLGFGRRRTPPGSPVYPQSDACYKAGPRAEYPGLYRGQSWSEDPTAIQVLQSLKGLKYIGAMLNKRVGDSLVAQGVVLCSAYGAMEIAVVTPFFTSHGKDWDYISLREGVDAVVLPENDGSGMYTHAYLVGPHFAAAFTNTEIEGHLGCALSDLLEQHPDPAKSHLHRVYGRKDDLIPFSSAAKMNPVPIGLCLARFLVEFGLIFAEAQINRNPFVENSVVFGQGRCWEMSIRHIAASAMPRCERTNFNRRSHPGIIVQIRPEVGSGKTTEILASIWASVEAVNKESPTHFRIRKECIILADPAKPFSVTSKFQPRRRVVVEEYRDEIDSVYDSKL